MKLIALLLFSLFSLQAKDLEENEPLIPEYEKISDQQARLEYAEVLSTGELKVEEALHQYDLLVKEESVSKMAWIRKAQLLVRFQRFSEASELLYNLETENLKSDELIETARLASDLGYYTKSQQLFCRAGFKDLNNSNFNSIYGSSMRVWGDYAKSLFLETNENNLSGIIESLMGASRFYEAEAMAKNAFESGEVDRHSYLRQWVEIKKRRDDFDALIALVDLQPNITSWMKYEKSYALFKLNRYEEALLLLRDLEGSWEFAQSAVLLKGRIYRKQGECAQAQLAFLEAQKIPLREVEIDLFLDRSPDSQNSPQTWNQIASFYADEGDLEGAICAVAEALLLDQNHVPSQILRANYYAAAFDYPAALEIYLKLLKEFPGNTKMLYEVARLLSWDKKFCHSLAYYQQILEIDPTDFLAQLERARVASWGKMHEFSMSYYRELLSQMGSYPVSLEQAIYTIWLEKEAVWFRWRYDRIEALKVCRRLAFLNPGSDFYKFEYGQALCTVGLCEEAENEYREIVDLHPLHTLARYAYSREEDLERVETTLGYTYWNEMGYGDLSQVGRYEVNLAVTYPISCSEKVAYIQRRWLEHTFYDSHYHLADGQSLLWENRFSPYTKVSTSITRKHYLKDFGTTYTGFVQFDFTLPLSIDCQLGYKRSDEIYNYFNLTQTTQANIFWGKCHRNFSHLTEGSFEGRFVEYNDSNSQVHLIAQIDHAFTEHPNIFKMSLTSEYRNTAHTNIFIYNQAGQLVNIIFPYWAPQGYFLGQLQFEWRHDYGFFQFCNAPEQFFDLKVACGEDNQDNPYWQVKGEWVHEFGDGWKLSCAGYLHGSPQWRAKGLWCSLGVKF